MKEIIRLMEKFKRIDSWLRQSSNVNGNELNLVLGKQKRRAEFIGKMLTHKGENFMYSGETYSNMIISHRKQKIMEEKFNENYFRMMKDFISDELE